jgi:glycogen(starch) synthase
MEKHTHPAPAGAAPMRAGSEGLRVLLGVNIGDPRGAGLVDLVKALRGSGATVGVACFHGHPHRPDSARAGFPTQWPECDRVFLPPPMPPSAAQDRLSDWVSSVSAAFGPDVVHLADARHANLPWGAPVLVEADPCLGEGRRWKSEHNEIDRFDRRQVAAGLVAADLVVASTRSGLEELSRFYGPFEATFLIPTGCSPRIRRARRKTQTIFSVAERGDLESGLWDRIAPCLDWPVSVATGFDGAVSGPGAGCVEHLGTLPPAVLNARLDSAAIYGAPSRHMPAGDLILQAASRGCALVLGDLPGLREHWEGAAVFIPPHEEEAWCGLLQLLIYDESARRELGFRARIRARRFSARARAKRCLGAYECLLSKVG